MNKYKTKTNDYSTTVGRVKVIVLAGMVSGKGVKVVRLKKRLKSNRIQLVQPRFMRNLHEPGEENVHHSVGGRASAGAVNG